MSTFKPFKALRPVPEKVKEVASKPYDVLDTEEAREEAKGNPNSFYHVIKPEIDFPADHNPYDASVYQKGKENFTEMVKNGIIKQDEKEQFYVYRLKMNQHVQTGIVGCCAIDDYLNNVIKKHELTRPDKEEDRKNHVRHQKMNSEPVFFSYPHVEEIDSLVAEVVKGDAEYDFTADDGVQHTLWVVSEDELIQQIEGLFTQEVPFIYVADGHHRTAAGALVGKEMRNEDEVPDFGKRYNFFMAVCFPDNQLDIIDYNRVVKDLNGLSQEEFLNMIRENFDLEKQEGQYKPTRLHTMGMFLNGNWYKLTAKDGTYNDNDPVGVLDVTILSKYILEPVLGITDLRNDKRIDFVGGIRGLGELERRVNEGGMKVAFAMHPVSMRQIIDISDAGLIMPPKVTWFEPKLRSGLFVHSLVD